jgi:DNA-binding transcriptional MerR regulator
VSIGQVLDELSPEFPDVSPSKIRFLEAEGLIQPLRSSSGYRRFSAADITRLRFILTAQRDEYLPLRVIKERLDALDGPVVQGAGVQGAGAKGSDVGGVPPVAMTRSELLAAAGAAEVGFGDTTGMANPAYVGEFFAAAIERLPGVEVTAHFHNTRGQGLANAYAALQAGCTSFESSFGELGGCPVPAGSTGNISSEDLISMFEEMGVSTGVSLPALIDAARAAQTVLGRKLTSHSLIAGPIDWAPNPDANPCH